jgi:hypothetical protein
MHFLVGMFVLYVVWSNPVLRALALGAITALFCFGLIGGVAAWIIWAVVTAGITVEARDEMQARREWREGNALIRRAALRRARREIDG